MDDSEITSSCINGNSDVDMPECPICLDIVIEPVVLPCKHEVCHACLQLQLKKTSLDCPVCRRRVGTWVRTCQRQNKSLIDEDRWKHVQEKYQIEIQARMQREASKANAVETGPNHCKVHHVIAQPGEIRKEYESEFAKELEEQEQLRQEEELLSSVKIAEIKQEDEYSYFSEKYDAVLAKYLNRGYSYECAMKEAKRSWPKPHRSQQTAPTTDINVAGPSNPGRPTIVSTTAAASGLVSHIMFGMKSSPVSFNSDTSYSAISSSSNVTPVCTKLEEDDNEELMDVGASSKYEGRRDDEPNAVCDSDHQTIYLQPSQTRVDTGVIKARKDPQSALVSCSDSAVSGCSAGAADVGSSSGRCSRQSSRSSHSAVTVAYGVDHAVTAHGTSSTLPTSSSNNISPDSSAATTVENNNDNATPDSILGEQLACSFKPIEPMPTTPPKKMANGELSKGASIVRCTPRNLSSLEMLTSQSEAPSDMEPSSSASASADTSDMIYARQLQRQFNLCDRLRMVHRMKGSKDEYKLRNKKLNFELLNSSRRKTKKLKRL